ncbi:MAG: signal peptidase I [Pseudomonadota bacterium]
MRLFILLAFLMFAGPVTAQCFCVRCVTPQFQSFQIVSEAMAPTQETGSCAVATMIDPTDRPIEPGDILAFEEVRNGQTIIFIFRMVAGPGDVVEMRNGVVWVNNAAVQMDPMDPYARTMDDRGRFQCTNAPVAPGETCLANRFTETLPNGRSYEVLDIRETQVDNTPAMEIPPGHVFVMGDNRDNAADSRIPAPHGRGTIPLERVIGVFEE